MSNDTDGGQAGLPAPPEAPTKAKAKGYQWPEGMPHCAHCEPRGTNRMRPTWWWCSTRARQIGPRRDCGEKCEGWKEAGDGARRAGVSPAGVIRDDHSATVTIDGETVSAAEATVGLGGAIKREQEGERRASETDAPTRTTGGATSMAQGNVRKGIKWDGPANAWLEQAPAGPELWEWARDQIAGGRKQSEIAGLIGCAPNSMNSAIKTREKRDAKAGADGTEGGQAGLPAPPKADGTAASPPRSPSPDRAPERGSDEGESEGDDGADADGDCRSGLARDRGIDFDARGDVLRGAVIEFEQGHLDEIAPSLLADFIRRMGLQRDLAVYLKGRRDECYYYEKLRMEQREGESE